MTQEQFNTMMTAINATNAQRGFNGYHFAAPPNNRSRKRGKGGAAKGGEKAGGGKGGKGGKGGNAGGKPDNNHNYLNAKRKTLQKMIGWVNQALVMKNDSTSKDTAEFSADITNRIRKIAKECEYTPSDDWVAKYTLLAKNLASHEHNDSKEFFRAINTDNVTDDEDSEKTQHLKEVSFFLMLLLNAHKFETKDKNADEVPDSIKVHKYLSNKEMRICKDVVNQILQICFSALFTGGEGSKGFNTNPYERVNKEGDKKQKGTFDGFRMGRKFRSGLVENPKNIQIVHLGNTSAEVLKKVHVHMLKKNGSKDWLQVEFYVAAEKDDDFEASYAKLPKEDAGFAHEKIRQLLMDNLMFVNCYSRNQKSMWTMGGETFKAKMKDFEYGKLPYSKKGVKFASKEPKLLELAEALKDQNVMNQDDEFSYGYTKPVTQDLHGVDELNKDLKGVIDTFLPSLGINSRRTSMLSWN